MPTREGGLGRGLEAVIGPEAGSREQPPGPPHDLVAAIEELTDDVRALRAQVEAWRFDAARPATFGQNVGDMVAQLSAELPAVAGRIALTSLHLIVTPVRLAGTAAIRFAAAMLR